MTSTLQRMLSAPIPPDCRDAAAFLNRGSVCSSVDHERLRQALAGLVKCPSDAAPQATIPHYFSDTMVFVADAHLQQMADLIDVVERLAQRPEWRERVFVHAPAIARHTPKAAGVFLGYDFHLGAQGPQLIEINTNAGGGLLNAKLLRAQRDCCPAGEATRPEELTIEADFVAMFRQEWRLARGEAPLTRIAIVDAAPAGQFLALEFELFRQLFEANGISAVIADPAELSFDGERLSYAGQTVDLVYNRLTDFALDDPQNAALRAAYLADTVVLTPHPQAHACYADKRNLVLLTDDDWLASIGISAADRQILQAGVPRTEDVTPENAAEFWTTRKHWFFKPSAGYGSKAAYRGDKLTRRVFIEISRGGYVAQALVLPSERRLLVDGVEQDLKVDLRNYVYRNEVQLVSARLYQGQTTNFRTPGGGFAAVFSVACQPQITRTDEHKLAYNNCQTLAE